MGAIQPVHLLLDHANQRHEELCLVDSSQLCILLWKRRQSLVVVFWNLCGTEYNDETSQFDQQEQLHIKDDNRDIDSDELRCCYLR